MDARWLVAALGVGVAGGVAGFALGRRQLALATGARAPYDETEVGILAYPAGEPGHIFTATYGTRARSNKSQRVVYVDSPAASDLRDSAPGYGVGPDGALYLRFDKMSSDLMLLPETRFTMPGQVGMLYRVSDDDPVMSKAILAELVKSGAAVSVPVNMLSEDRPRKGPRKVPT